MTNYNKETRIYKITGKPHHLDQLEHILAHIGHLGAAGASRCFSICVDGDGDAYIRFERDNKLLSEIHAGNKEINNSNLKSLVIC